MINETISHGIQAIRRLISFRNMNKAEYPTCKTCRFWGEAPAWGRLDGKSVIFRDCTNPKLDNDAEPDGVYISAMDGHPHNTSGPDFGCIHHEAKG